MVAFLNLASQRKYTTYSNTLALFVDEKSTLSSFWAACIGETDLI